MTSCKDWLPIHTTPLIICALSVISATAQDEFFYHDTFDDGDVSLSTDGGVWTISSPAPGATLDASTGDLIVDSPNGFTLVPLGFSDGDRVFPRQDWSFRTLLTTEQAGFVGVGTTAFNHAALQDGNLRVGTGGGNIANIPMPYDYFGSEVYLQMDMFGNEITASVWKPGMPDSLVQNSGFRTLSTVLPAFGVGDSSNPAHATFHEAWVSSAPLPINIVPEPSTITLGSLACGAMVCFWRRARKRLHD